MNGVGDNLKFRDPRLVAEETMLGGWQPGGEYGEADGGCSWERTVDAGAQRRRQRAGFWMVELAGAKTIKKTQDVGLSLGNVTREMRMEPWRGGLAGEAVLELGNQVDQRTAVIVGNGDIHLLDHSGGRRYALPAMGGLHSRGV